MYGKNLSHNVYLTFDPNYSKGCASHLIEEIEQSIVHNGVKVLHLAAMVGIEDPAMRFGCLLKPLFGLWIVTDFENELGFPHTCMRGGFCLAHNLLKLKDKVTMVVTKEWMKHTEYAPRKLIKYL